MTSTQSATSNNRNAHNVVRGTQSFVGVMAQVWKRPALTGFEVLWRWSFGVVLFAVFVSTWGRRIMERRELFDYQLLEDNAISMQLWLREHGATRVYGITRHSFEIVVLTGLVWAAVSAAGRAGIMHKLEPSLRPNMVPLVLLSVLRVVSLTLVVIGWFLGVSAVAERMVFVPLLARQEPDYVPFAAVLIVGTLVLFILWMVTSYVFHLAPLLSMAQRLSAFRSLREALRRGPLQSKLIEINLVLGIVKIILIVLAMVFSACPLPFSNVETREFLEWWCAGVGFWYLLASDYFHVVRSAAYIALWRAYQTPQNETLPKSVKSAS